MSIAEWLLSPPGREEFGIQARAVAAVKSRESREEMTSTRSLRKVVITQGSLLLVPSHSSVALSNPSQDAGIQGPNMFSIFIFIYFLTSLYALN